MVLTGEFCIFCGALAHSDAAVCEKCGRDNPYDPEATMWSCANCGFYLTAVAKYCSECGRLARKKMRRDYPETLPDDHFSAVKEEPAGPGRNSSRSEAYYFDDKGKFTTAEKATHGIIREVDENGMLLRETFGYFASKSQYDSFDEYTAMLERMEEEEKRRKL